MRFFLTLFLISKCYCLFLHEITTSPPITTSSVLTDKHYNFLLDLLAEEKQLRQQLQRTVIQQEEDLKNITKLLSQIQHNTIGCNDLEQIATGKSATQSSTNGVYLAKYAVDGLIDTFSHTQAGGQANPWWLLDLDGVYNIERIEIYNRADCCGDRLHFLQVSIGKTISNTTVCGYFAGPGVIGQHIILKCPIPLSGRYVKVMIYNRNTPSQTDTLQLAEVLVYARL